MKALNKLKVSLVSLLPPFIRGPYLRSKFSVNLDQTALKNVTFKIAETRDEFNDAFKLIQKTYVESNISNNPYNEKRILKYNLLPTSWIFIAVYENKVIGTISYIMDSEMGVPMDSFIDIEPFRKTGKRVCEISGLAISKEWRSKGAGLSFPLIISSFKYCFDYIGIDYFLIVTNLNGKLYYQDIGMFESFSGKARKYEFANDADGFVQFVNRETYIDRLKKAYPDKTDLSKNFYKLWRLFPWEKKCLYPHFDYKYIINPSQEVVLNHYVEKEALEVKNDLSEKEVLTFNNLHHMDYYKKKIKLKNESVKSQRNSPRYLVNVPIVYSINKNLKTAKIFDVCLGGFLVHFEDKEDIPEFMVGRIKFYNGDSTIAKANLAWKKGNQAGFTLRHVDYKIWIDFISYIGKKYKSEKRKKVA